MSTHLEQMFKDHAHDDEVFQQETRVTSQSILDSLQSLHDKLNPAHASYINRQLEAEVATIRADQAPLLELYNGFTFGRKAVIGTAGFVGAVTVIVGSLLGLLKILKP